MELSSAKNTKLHEGNFGVRKVKKKKHSENISYISGNGTFEPQA